MKKKKDYKEEINNIKKEKARTLNREAYLVTLLSSITQFRVPELRCKGDRMCYRALAFTGDKIQLLFRGNFFWTWL